MPWFTCSVCGEDFKKELSRMRGNSRLCSRSCFRKSFGTLEERFRSKTVPGENGCILWTGRISKKGYGDFSVNGKTVGAHVFAYEQAYGPVPEGMELDHKCRVRPCVNAEHLRPMTHRDNVLCGKGFPGINSRKTHCIRGHELDEGNTFQVIRHGAIQGRGCRKCRRMRKAAGYYKGGSSPCPGNFSSVQTEKR